MDILISQPIYERQQFHVFILSVFSLYLKPCIFILVAQLVKNPPAMRETWVDPWVGKIPWRRESLLMTNLDSILKSRDITLPTKVHLVKAMVFPVVVYGCESCTVKKAERSRIGAFELWCWRRPLRVPWTASRSKQSILKEISSVYSLERLMLKLKLQYFGHLMGRVDSLEKTLMLGEIWGRRRRGSHLSG